MPALTPGGNMKSVHYKILAVVAAVMLGATALLAQGHGHGRGGFGHMLGSYTDYLDLTDAQQQQMKAIMEKEKPAFHTAMQQMGQFRTQMKALEEANTFDEGKVRALAAQQSQAMTDMIVEKARVKSEMLQVLTADQRAKLSQFEAKREQRMQQRMQRMHQSQSQSSTSN